MSYLLCNLFYFNVFLYNTFFMLFWCISVSHCIIKHPELTLCNKLTLLKDCKAIVDSKRDLLLKRLLFFLPCDFKWELGVYSESRLTENCISLCVINRKLSPKLKLSFQKLSGYSRWKNLEKNTLIAFFFFKGKIFKLCLCCSLANITSAHTEHCGIEKEERFHATLNR